MLKQLRLKFILITMTLVTVMLAVILGMVVHFTRENLENQSIQMMQSIAADPFQLGPPDAPAKDVRLPYFAVQINSRGDVLATGGGYFDLSNKALVLEITEAALRSPRQVGVLQKYNLRFCKITSCNGDGIVFADMTSEQDTMNNLIRTCLVIGLLGFVAFLFLSIRLAKWATQPVEDAWKNQKQFVADASHELKTPLTVIMTNAELLRSPDCGDAAREQFSGSILTMAHQMRGLVEGLLDLARVDNGAVKTAFGPVDMSALVSEGCLPFEPLFFENGLILESDIESGLTLKGSVIHLEQVLKILLDNALKYSDPGTVRVTLRRSSGNCLLTVSNPGPEIPAEDRKNIFKRFYRGDKARHRDGSYGLGLSIAENILREHGGKIWVESTDTVNSFHVQLPLN